MISIRQLLPRTLRTFLVGVLNGVKRYTVIPNRFGYLSPTAKIAAPINIENHRNVYIKEEASIGSHSTILAKNARFIMKRWSVSAGNLTVVTGNHARIIGRFLLSIKEHEKPEGLDKDVIVNEDVWMGMNVTILSGVEIGRGCTIAAGAVVTKSLPPYCIAGGVPAKILKFYWTIDQIIVHEKVLYPIEERFSKFTLESIFNEYSK